MGVELATTGEVGERRVAVDVLGVADVHRGDDLYDFRQLGVKSANEMKLTIQRFKP